MWYRILNLGRRRHDKCILQNELSLSPQRTFSFSVLSHLFSILSFLPSCLTLEHCSILTIVLGTKLGTWAWKCFCIPLLLSLQLCFFYKDRLRRQRKLGRRTHLQHWSPKSEAFSLQVDVRGLNPGACTWFQVCVLYQMCYLLPDLFSIFTILKSLKSFGVWFLNDHWQ